MCRGISLYFHSYGRVLWTFQNVDCTRFSMLLCAGHHCVVVWHRVLVVLEKTECVAMFQRLEVELCVLMLHVTAGQ